MIEINFFTQPEGGITGFHITGHAAYGEAGSDIVCAAVSSAAYMAANMITEVLGVNPLALRADDGDMLVRVENRDIRTCRDIFAALKIHFINLEEQYAEYICVSYMEV